VASLLALPRKQVIMEEIASRCGNLAIKGENA
jgi:hypothetical protein